MPTAEDATLKQAVVKSTKRSLDVFLEDHSAEPAQCLESQRIKVSSKVMSEYATVKDLAPPERMKGEAGASSAAAEGSETQQALDAMAAGGQGGGSGGVGGGALVLHKGGDGVTPGGNALALSAGGAGLTSTALALSKKAPPKVHVPDWHAPWKLKAVVSGHLGWVRAISFDPSNKWFVTGSADRTIKVWDLAKCSVGAPDGLMLTLTGHISCVRGLAVSDRTTYMFSVAEDKMVKCWDLEQNKVVRHYHGHLSGVYACELHPSLDLLVTAGRDSVARVWDIRTARSAFVLGGHQNTVGTILCNPVDPQIITGSHDCQVRLWDLAAGKTMATLTNHKKAVRCLASHPREFSFVSAAADNLKKWQTRDGKFMRNLSGHNTIINAVACNEDGVLVSGGDNGSLHFWDYSTGYNFQQMDTIVQPGSLDAEAGIYAMGFDKTGTRLITCEADKTLKIWAEDDTATEDSHPIDMKAWTKACRQFKRY